MPKHFGSDTEFVFSKTAASTNSPKGRLARIGDRGIHSQRKYYELEERFSKLVGLQAVRVLASGSAATAADFAAFAAANEHFEHLGTNTEVVTLAQALDFGGGIKLATAVADADSCIILPSLITADSGWAVAKQWASHRSPRFEAVITPTPTSYITTVALTSNVILITTGAAHGLAPGESVKIKLDQSDSDYATTSDIEGTWTVATVATTTTFTIAYTHANITSAAIVGYCLPVTPSQSVGIAITTFDLTSNVCTVTVSGKHGWGVGDLVTVIFDRTSAAYVALGAAAKALLTACEGTQTITSSYSAAATTFTFSKTAADIVTGSFTGNARENATHPNITKTCIWAGFKKTNTPVIATDDDQCYLTLCTQLSGATSIGSVSKYWQFITSRAGTDTVTILTNVDPPVMGNTYRIEIEIDVNRIPTLRINGNKIDIGGAATPLTSHIDFIPYVGVFNAGVMETGKGSARSITLSYLSCQRAHALP